MPSVTVITCPECDEPLKVPESVFGKKIKCKHCEHAFVAKDPDAGQKKAAVKPSKPGPAAPVKKEPPKPEPEPKPDAAAPYKFQDDEDEDAMGAKPKPLGVIADGEDIPRCAFCAQELDPPDALVCIHCGFNSQTRVRAESKKVWAPDANDYLNHLGPGVLALLICIAIITLDVICYTNMRDWMTGTFLQKDDTGPDGSKGFYIKPGAFITLILAITVMPIIGTARFAIKRLIIDNKPAERVKV